MNQLQHLLTKLAEEGTEIAQIALKTSQFGPYEVMPGQPLNNFQRCHQEIDDLMAIVEMLNNQYEFGYKSNRKAIEEKKVKVQKYLGYSIHLGLVEGVSNVTQHPMILEEQGYSLLSEGCLRCVTGFENEKPVHPKLEIQERTPGFFVWGCPACKGSYGIATEEDVKLHWPGKDGK